jgi:hypothetical protein
MEGPGQYVSDATEGISCVEDLPEAKIVRRSCNYRRRPCPHCGQSSYRDRSTQRTLHDLGDLVCGRPHEIELTYSVHYCVKCHKYFNADMSGVASPGSHYTKRVINLAVRVVVEDGLPYGAASWHMWRDHRVFVPFATIQNWVEAGGEKRRRGASILTISTGRWITSPATLPRMNCTTVPTVCCPSWTTAPSSASPMKSWTTILPTTTSATSSGVCRQPCSNAACSCAALLSFAKKFDTYKKIL